MKDKFSSLLLRNDPTGSAFLRAICIRITIIILDSGLDIAAFRISEVISIAPVLLATPGLYEG